MGMSAPLTCQRCEGEGFVRVPMRDDWDGFSGEYAERDCPDCDATGLRAARDEEAIYWERLSAHMERER
jgi:DnaJ-class molecular chaperone